MFVTCLKCFGYNPIRLPRANIRPLEILAKSGKDPDWMGELTEVFVTVPGMQPSAIDNEIQASNVSGQRTGDMSIGLGLSLLGNVIGALCGSKLGLDVAYKGAKTAVFEVTDALSDAISIARFDQYLGAAGINPYSVTLGKLLEADQVYVVTSTIKSTRFAIEAKRSGGASLDLSIPIVQEIVGGWRAVPRVERRARHPGRLPHHPAPDAGGGVRLQPRTRLRDTDDRGGSGGADGTGRA